MLLKHQKDASVDNCPANQLYPKMVFTMKEEFDSPTLVAIVQAVLEALRRDGFKNPKNTRSVAEDIGRLVIEINTLKPQNQMYFKGDKYKRKCLRRALIDFQ